MTPIKTFSDFLMTLKKFGIIDEAYVAEDSLINGKWYAYVRCKNMKAKHRKLHVWDWTVWTT